MSLSGCSLLCNAHLNKRKKKKSGGILSLSGITLWTTCSSGAMSAVVCCHASKLPLPLPPGRWLRLQRRDCLFPFVDFLPIVLIFFSSLLSATAAHLPCRGGARSLFLLHRVSSELINSLGLYDWEGGGGAWKH